MKSAKTAPLESSKKPELLQLFQLYIILPFAPQAR